MNLKEAGENYIEVNRHTYDELAEEFDAKRTGRLENTYRIVENFASFLKDGARDILELGPAAGNDTAILVKKGYQVDGIELSPKLAGICQRNVPEARIITGDFLEYQFEKTFDGILAIAFVHLFPKADTLRVLEKIYRLLNANGVAYISTTLHDKADEGWDIKYNFNKKSKRYRRRFTEKELKTELTQAGFTILEINTIDDKEEKGKTWIDFIVKK